MRRLGLLFDNLVIRKICPAGKALRSEILQRFAGATKVRSNDIKWCKTLRNPREIGGFCNKNPIFLGTTGAKFKNRRNFADSATALR
jgi:hypothetical protein